jgi:hypothetical protein
VIPAAFRWAAAILAGWALLAVAATVLRSWLLRHHGHPEP